MGVKISCLLYLVFICLLAVKTLKQWKKYVALTTVGDDTDGGVPLAETRDGREAHLVRLGLYQLSQVMRHELSFVDCSIHWDLLLPPALEPHLCRKKNHMRFGILDIC